MDGYSTSIKPPREIAPTELQAMTKLYLQHYDGSSPEQFARDLSHKTEVLLLHHHGELVGFTTLAFYLRKWAGQEYRIVYSGDTVVAKAHWGQQALAFAWIRHLAELKIAWPNIPHYWFLVVKGHRTFKFLTAFARSFYPHWSLECSDLKPFADQLATDHFGDAYNRATGVVEFARSKGHLKAELAAPLDREMEQPAVRFFMHRNPGFQQHRYASRVAARSNRYPPTNAASLARTD